MRQEGVKAQRVVGIDEAGRGPLAGPVVVAGVILPEKHGIKGLNDSKKLTEKRREELFEQIMAKGEVFVEQASAAVIDRDGILVCTRRLMKRIVQRSKVDMALLDAVNVDLYNVLQMALTKGDQRVDCIAAASIVAKVTRDRLMVKFDRRYPGYGLADHKGYGTEKHRHALEKTGLTVIHRKSFCGAFLGA